MVVEFFKDPTESYPLNETQIKLIKYYIDDRDFGHDNLPWIYHKNGSKELTDWHKQAIRMIKNIDISTENERQENYKARQEEKEERTRKDNAIAARQRGFIPRAPAKPRPKFPKKSQLVAKGQVNARKLDKTFGGDYAKFREEMLKKIRKHESELRLKRKRATRMTSS